MTTNPQSQNGRAMLRRAVTLLCLLSGFSFQVSSFGANVFGYLEGATNAPAGLPVKFTYAPGMSVYPIYRFQQAITITTQTNGYFILSNANPGLCYLSPGNGLANIGLNVPNDTNSHNFLDILAVSNSVPALVPSTYYLGTNGNGSGLTNLQAANIVWPAFFYTNFGAVTSNHFYTNIYTSPCMVYLNFTNVASLAGNCVNVIYLFDTESINSRWNIPPIASIFRENVGALTNTCAFQLPSGGYFSITNGDSGATAVQTNSCQVSSANIIFP
jgi:hypothetical protein